jgi:small-conductance mechanosensitive channel
MSNWSELARRTLFDNSAAAWLHGILAFLLTFLIVPVLRAFLRAQRRRYANREAPLAIALLTDLAEHTGQIMWWIAALYVADKVLTLPKGVDRAFDLIIIAGFWLQVGLWASAAVRFGLQRHQARSGDARLTSTMDILLFVMRIIVWSIVILLALENLGINVGPLVAGLGVGGIAIALAVQTVLGDLLASLSIALDKPFAVGDALRVDAFEGTVEQIGIKSTRMRSITGEQIIIANADLLKSRVRNLGRASERRGVFTLLLSYETSPDLLDQVPALVKAAIASYEGTRFVNCLLKELGESGVLFETIYFVENRPGREVGYAQDQINRQLLREFAQRGIRFAHPARTLWFRQNGQPMAAVQPPIATPGP